MGHERDLLEAKPQGADGTQVGAGVGHSFAEAGKGDHCQQCWGLPQAGMLAFGFLTVQTGLE